MSMVVKAAKIGIVPKPGEVMACPVCGYTAGVSVVNGRMYPHNERRIRLDKRARLRRVVIYVAKNRCPGTGNMALPLPVHRRWY
jgi:hypothetical protein